MILWRPTENNQRYGLDQLASDDFEGDEHMEAELDNLERQGHGQNISLRTGHKVREPEEHDDVEIFDVGGDMDDDDDDEVLQWAEKHVYESDADATSPAKSSSSVNKLS